MKEKQLSRRKFIGQASCAGLGYLTFMNSFLNLKAINSAAISNSAVGGAFNDYKAIVCVLFAGGMDSYNMLVPYDSTNHSQYVNARSGLIKDGGLAIPRNATQQGGSSHPHLGNTVLNYTNAGKQWALHPSMGRLRNLFNSGKAAFLSNVGTLLKPTTKTQYYSNQDLPLGLFSHSDQEQQWQTGIPDARGAVGWAGKIADLIGDGNGNQEISMNVSLSGSNIWQTGDISVEYAIDPYYGAIGIDGYNPDATWSVEIMRTRAIDSLLGSKYQDIFRKTYMHVVRNARDGFLEFQDALNQSHVFPAGTFPDTYLGNALEMIAKTISVRNILNFQRQIFFVVLGGWDHHDEVLNNQLAMLGEVSEALGSFQDALAPSGINMENNVLTMTISEFARTLTSNGNGSDHGWGGNVTVLGGQNLINGGVVYGNYPSMVPGSTYEIGIGRYIPTLSTDEYFAEVAKWFGVPGTDLPVLFPNIGEFYTPTSPNLPIGFIKQSAV